MQGLHRSDGLLEAVFQIEAERIEMNIDNAGARPS